MISQEFVKFNSDTLEIICCGEWDLANIAVIKKELDTISFPKESNPAINGKNITKIDSAGAWLILNWMGKSSSSKSAIKLVNFSEQYKKLFALIEKYPKTRKNIPMAQHLSWVEKLGEYSLRQLKEFYEYLSFTGELAIQGLYMLCRPTLWRWRPIVSTINTTGSQALPIIALLSFMIGIVISYQMGNQLRSYGANVFIVNLLGLSILREFGPLITAIMVAGRTGSAFTAQLGIMKINQEIDALNTMGVTPTELLILPRLIGLFIVLSLLTMWADIFGIIGGMVMAKTMLNVTPYEFLHRFQHEIPLRSLVIGLCKAPVFALLIATIACFQGMEVRGSAENAGARTTRSVVLSIFFIIITDALFSIIFSKFDL